MKRKTVHLLRSRCSERQKKGITGMAKGSLYQPLWERLWVYVLNSVWLNYEELILCWSDWGGNRDKAHSIKQLSLVDLRHLTYYMYYFFMSSSWLCQISVVHCSYLLFRKHAGILLLVHANSNSVTKSKWLSIGSYFVSTFCRIFCNCSESHFHILKSVD